MHSVSVEIYVQALKSVPEIKWYKETDSTIVIEYQYDIDGRDDPSLQWVGVLDTLCAVCSQVTLVEILVKLYSIIMYGGYDQLGSISMQKQSHSSTAGVASPSITIN